MTDDDNLTRRAFAACDAVALPTAPTAAFPLGERTADPLRMYLSDVFTVPASLTGLPASKDAPVSVR